MEERRKLKRQLLRYYIWVFENNNNSLIGHVGDITKEGIMLVSKEPIMIGETIQFRMVPSRFKIKESRVLKCTGICVWSKTDVNPDFKLAGFKLDKLEKNEEALICKLISESKY